MKCNFTMQSPGGAWHHVFGINVICYKNNTTGGFFYCVVARSLDGDNNTLHKDGRTEREIAAETGLGQSTVHRYIQANRKKEEPAAAATTASSTGENVGENISADIIAPAEEVVKPEGYVISQVSGEAWLDKLEDLCCREFEAKTLIRKKHEEMKAEAQTLADIKRQERELRADIIKFGLGDALTVFDSEWKHESEAPDGV